MDVRVLYEVVIPLLIMASSCLICISTVRGEDNFFSRLLELKDDHGNLIFVVIRFTLRCDKPQCRKNPQDCVHKLGLLPPWQSPFKVTLSVFNYGSPRTFTHHTCVLRRLSVSSV